MLTCPRFEAKGLVKQSKGALSSILLPINAELRATLNVIENFVAHNVTIPADALSTSKTGSLYRPLWHAEKMMITVSNWCKFFQLNLASTAYECVPADTNFGKGVYYVSFEIPYVYIGPHRDGQAFSLTLRVVQVLFEPDVPSASLLLHDCNENHDVVLSGSTSSLNPPKTVNIILSDSAVSATAKKSEVSNAQTLPASAPVSVELDGALPSTLPSTKEATEGKKRRGRKNGAAPLPLSEFK